MEPALNRECLYCRKPIKGRSDKKFCDDNCRNAYAFEQKKTKKDIFLPVIEILKKNRNILEQLHLASPGYPHTKEDLIKAGYDFDYCTQHRGSHPMDTYCCFDMGFYAHDDFYVIFQRNDDITFVYKTLEQVQELEKRYFSS